MDETISFIIGHKPRYVLASKYMETPGMTSATLPDKVDDATRVARLRRFAAAMKQAGIICNSEEGEIIRNRFQRIRKGA